MTARKHCTHSADGNKRKGCPWETEPNVNHNSLIVKLILFGCTISWLLYVHRLLTGLSDYLVRETALKQMKFIPYCPQKQLFNANTYYILSTIFRFKSTSYITWILRETLWFKTCLCFVKRNFPLSLLEYFWKLLRAGLPLVLPKLYLWFNYSAVQIPD